MRRLLLLLAACGKHAPHDEPPPPLDPATIYPQLAPVSALPTGPVRRTKPGLDGLVITLAAPRGESPVRAELGSDGKPVDLVWGHDWRAAACILLPGVAQQAHAQLGPTVYAVVPDRAALILFADPAVAAKALAAEQGAPNKLSDQTFTLP